ncbi:plasmid stabilization protein [Labedella gwakjiensis]|uniref:Plasmid stabilization protein n=1 Tax=Labedella gwakjiensis TaxID=390269 RepID=A0ABY0C3W6_9MICO|nr:plasmid stabilization protein [Labedella gwakjiensis]
MRSARAVLAIVLASMTLAGCAPTEPPAVADTIRVPDDAPTITDAVAEATPGDLILVAPGVYRESVIVDVADVTIRGEDRNETVIDGEGVRPYGVVGIADGVRVENLTSHSHLYYGVLITGVHTEDGPEARGASGYAPFDPDDFPPLQRFGVDHVTAYNNGLYGIYAFNAQHGSITDSYASGSADSGIYVGQCRECDTLVQGNVAERNAIGFENANASDSVVITGNRFSDNRVGMTLISNYQEAFTPQHANVVAGNVVADNNSSESPAHAEGAFGVGIGVQGGQQNLFDANVVTGHEVAGVVFSSTEDLAATDNRIERSTLEGNGVDVANTSADRAPASGNCAESDGPLSTLPQGLDLACADSSTSQASGALPTVEVPPGVSFLRVDAPPAQPSLDDVSSLPDPLPDATDMPSLDDVDVPPSDLLSDLTRAQ